MYEVVHRPGGFTSDPNEALHRAIVFAMKGRGTMVYDAEAGELLWSVEPDTKGDDADVYHPAIVHAFDRSYALQNFVASASVTQGGHAKP